MELRAFSVQIYRVYPTSQNYCKYNISLFTPPYAIFVKYQDNEGILIMLGVEEVLREKI